MMKGRNIGHHRAAGRQHHRSVHDADRTRRRPRRRGLKVNQQLLSRAARASWLRSACSPAPAPYLGVDQGPAAGAPVSGGSFPRSFLIPGTDTSLRVGGQITEVMDYWFEGGNPNASPQSTTVGNNGQVPAIPLRHRRARAARHLSDQPAQIEDQLRDPHPDPVWRSPHLDGMGLGRFDRLCAGRRDPTSVSDNLVPRIRYAYGTLGGLLAGQATSNFSDPDANPESLDFGGNVGDPGHVRIPQIRYTHCSAVWGGASRCRLKRPRPNRYAEHRLGSGVIPTVTTCTSPRSALRDLHLGAADHRQLALNPAKATSPDFTAACTSRSLGAMSTLSLVLRPGHELTDGKFSAAASWAMAAISASDFKPGWFGWVEGRLHFHFSAVTAIGSYVNRAATSRLATNFVGPRRPQPGGGGGEQGRADHRVRRQYRLSALVDR